MDRNEGIRTRRKEKKSPNSAANRVAVKYRTPLETCRKKRKGRPRRRKNEKAKS